MQETHTVQSIISTVHDLAPLIAKVALPESPSANVLSLCPPFSISDDEIDFAVERLQEYLTFLPGSIS